MRLASLLGHSQEVLEEIIKQPQRPADLFLNRYFRKRRYLGSHDRRFIADHVYGTLRGFLRYQFLLCGDTGYPSPVIESVAPHLVGFALENGIDDIDALSNACSLPSEQIEEIRGVLKHGSTLMNRLSEPERSAVFYSLPLWFAERLTAQYGDDSQALMASLNPQGPTTIRANSLKTTMEELARAFEARGIASKPCSFAPDGLILEKRVGFNGLPEFKDGLFEVQDEGSQLLSIALDPRPEWRVFDACAGGGGKTLHLAALMEGRGEIVAHDANPDRLQGLVPRLERSRAKNVRIMSHSQYLDRCNDLAKSFDAVFIDAPCSGTGTLRRNPGMRLNLDKERLTELVQLQQDILREYALLVKPGGVLFYATCSLLREENQDQIERFLRERVEWSLIGMRIDESLVISKGLFQSCPALHGMDGFFGAKLRQT